MVAVGAKLGNIKNIKKWKLVQMLVHSCMLQSITAIYVTLLKNLVAIDCNCSYTLQRTFGLMSKNRKSSLLHLQSQKYLFKNQKENCDILIKLQRIQTLQFFFRKLLKHLQMSCKLCKMLNLYSFFSIVKF